MKAIILAAGKGTRMLPLTKTIPKVLIPINGKPFLLYVLKSLQQAGYSYHEIAIVAGYHQEKIAEFLKVNKIPATIIEQAEPQGTAHALRQVQFFCKQDQFIVQGGDNLFSVQDLQQVQINDQHCYVIGKEIEEWQKYGVLVVEDGKLRRIVEKPKEFVGRMINTGLYKFTSDIWQALQNITLSVRGEYELTDALSLLAQQEKVQVLPLKGNWLDLGSLEDIPKIEKVLRSS